MSWAAGAGDRAGAEPGGHRVFLLPCRLSSKEEVLCRLQEENRRLSQEQERVSGADGGSERPRDGGTGREPAEWVGTAARDVGQMGWVRQAGHGQAQGWGLIPASHVAHLCLLNLLPSQLMEELEREQQSKQRLEGERRETESNWEAQIADILSWWVPGDWGWGLGPGSAEVVASDPEPPS